MKIDIEIKEKLKDTAFVKRMLVILVLGSGIFTLLIFVGFGFLASNEDSFFGFLESLNEFVPEQLKSNGDISAYIVVAVIVLFFVVVIFSIFRRASKKHKRLKEFGVRTFCKVNEVKIVKFTNDRGKVIEQKDVYIKTPLGKGGSLQVSD